MPLEREREAGGLARNRDRERPGDVAIVHHRGPAEQVLIAGAGRQRIARGVEAGGRDHAELDHLRRPAARGRDHHQATAAETAHPGLENGQRQRGRERRIDGIAAAVEDPGADLGGGPMLRGDNSAGRAQRGLAAQPTDATISLVMHDLA